MIKNKFVILVNFLLLLIIVLNPVGSISARKDSSPYIISTRKIYTGKPYASFTSLVNHEGRFYCAFREAKNTMILAEKMLELLKFYIQGWETLAVLLNV